MLNLWRNPSDEVGKLFLRLAVGGLMLFHGIGRSLTASDSSSTLSRRSVLPGFIGTESMLRRLLHPC